MNPLPRRTCNPRVGWIAADLAALSLAYFLALSLRMYSLAGATLSGVIRRLFGLHAGFLATESARYYLVSAPRIIFYLAVPLIVLYGLFDLYAQHRFVRPRPMLWNLIRANAAVFGLVVAVLYLRRNIFHPRGFILLVFFLNIWTTALCRGVWGAAVRFFRARGGRDGMRAVLIGAGRDADWIQSLLDVRHPHGIVVAERLAMPVAGIPDAAIRECLRRCRADVLIVADAGCDVPRIMSLLALTAELDLSAKFLTEHLNVLLFKGGIVMETVHGRPLVHFDAPSFSRKDTHLRRILSRVLALVGLAGSLPLTLLAALAIRMEDRGPLFFVQERIGVNRRPFRMFKFRSMHVDADQMQAELESLNETDGGLFKIRRDPRVTRIGRLLRKFSIDELPQLINVLKGEMRLVGPRPLPRRDFANYYEDWHYARHAGMPGLTCLWQISGRSEIDFENMCILDLYYLRNQDWALDLKIILKTIWVVLFTRGAY